MLSTCHVSSRIVVDISESSLLCSQCFFRPHWNKDNMLSENYHYLYTCFLKLCSSDCFSFILSFPIISPYFRFIIKHKNYYGVICCMLSTCHVSSRIVADISESSLLFSQCFFRPYWNEDEMLSENYPYFYTCFSKFCSFGCFSYILCFRIISPHFWFLTNHKNYCQLM